MFHNALRFLNTQEALMQSFTVPVPAVAMPKCIAGFTSTARAISSNSFPAAKILFTSSTSVYAQCDGSRVTEESETKPLRETSRILLETENFVLDKGGIVARLAGIHGPGRSALAE